jgi:hypothetical protein
MCVTSANMAAVARWAGHKWVGRDMIVAGDDDWHLLDHPKVKRNVGKDAALQMAKMLPGRAIFPDMAGLVTDGGDDFNDMAREYGDAEVAATILSAEMAEVGGDADLDASADVLGFRLTDWSTDRFFGDAPPIRWLCEGSIPLGVPALFAAMGGVGKSFMALDMALGDRGRGHRRRQRPSYPWRCGRRARQRRRPERGRWQGQRASPDAAH